MTTFVKRVDYPMDGMTVPMLVGADPESSENLRKCKQDAIYRIVPKRDNNPMFHRKVMRLLRDLFENQGGIEHEEVFREYVKIQCGWVNGSFIDDKGAVQWATKPLTFDGCSQDEREEFWDKLKNYAAPILGHAVVESYEMERTYGL